MPVRKSTIGKNPLDAAPEPSPPTQPEDSGRRVFEAWVAATEATLESTFAAQNAALAAQLSVLETSAASNRVAIQRWAEAAREAQRAALEVFHANVLRWE
jgi:hypothetical protein